MDVKVPKPEMSDYGKVNFATEVAFSALAKQAKDLGLAVAPVMGLMYLPTQDITYQFQLACRAILLALTPREIQVGGSDGKQYFVGDENIPG